MNGSFYLGRLENKLEYINNCLNPSIHQIKLCGVMAIYYWKDEDELAFEIATDDFVQDLKSIYMKINLHHVVTIIATTKKYSLKNQSIKIL